jgi:hypothetical protein
VDKGLTDIDALLLTVRDQQTKNHLAEAVLAYRVGAYRLAIVGTWIAVAYDIIAKIRELAASDRDPQAVAFIDDFDRNVAANNVAKLLEIERGLIDTASTKFGFLGPVDANFVRRLQEDRHLCAHPASAKNNELFRPLPDAVRAHIVQSVESLLAAPPVSGKALIEAFVADVDSNAFPRGAERAVGYVQQRYLARMRPGAKRNLAVVLMKSVIGGNVPQLASHEESVFDALIAIDRDEPQTFLAEIVPVAADLLDRADEDDLVRGLALLRRFPAIVAHLPGTTMDRIHALASAPRADVGAFTAFGVVSDEVDFALMARFPKLEAQQMTTVLVTLREPRLVPAVVQAVREADTFRAAESRLANVVRVADMMSADDFALFVGAVAENPQVTNANGTPPVLLRLAQSAVDRGVHGSADWLKLRREVWYKKQFDPLWNMLAERGAYVAPPGQPPMEEDE